LPIYQAAAAVVKVVVAIQEKTRIDKSLVPLPQKRAMLKVQLTENSGRFHKSRKIHMPRSQSRVLCWMTHGREVYRQVNISGKASETRYFFFKGAVNADNDTSTLLLLCIDNFRHQSICPTDADINEDTYPDPPENIVHKAYDSTEQYLETHFRLLRADCTLPVRDAIRNYRHGTVEDNEMMIYINVRACQLAAPRFFHRNRFD